MSAADDLLLPERWQDEAMCRQVGPQLFFNEDDDEPTYAREAKRVCGQCPVKDECLEVALAGDEEGIWGGTTKGERREIQRDRRTAA